MSKIYRLVTFLIMLVLIASCATPNKSKGPKIKEITVTPKSVTTDAIVDIRFEVDITDSPNLEVIEHVLIDLTELNSVSDQQLYDDGSNGDNTADDGIYTYVLVGFTTPSTKQTLTVGVVVSDSLKEDTGEVKIQVVAHPKIVAFDVTPNPAKPGDTVSFSATVNQGEYPIFAVELDLTDIGGSATKAMNYVGSTWTFDYVIPDSGNPALPAGDYKVRLIASDDQNPPFQSEKELTLTLEKVKPSLGAISPEQTISGVDALFEYTIKSPTGLSNISEVICDFSEIGGVSNQKLYDDGTNGDTTSDDGVYSFLFIGATWDPTISALNTAYVEFPIAINQVVGNTIYTWAPLFVYKGTIIYVDDTYGDDSTGTGTDVDPYKTIQKGIDQASDGDIVLVNSGTYKGDGNRDLYYNGKLIIVKSAEGSAKTTINAGGISDPNHRIANFTKNETRESIMAGFTLTGGYITGLVHGGVFDVLDSCPGIISCIIKDNSAKERGGIMNVRVSILNFTTDPWLHRCYCENNSSGRNGGAIYSYNEASTTLTNSVFKDTTLNAVSSENVNGGVLYCYDASTYIENCVFENTLLKNTKSTYSARGGAIYIKSDKNKPDYHTKVINSIFINNVADSASGNGEGGAIYLYSSSTKVEIRSCTFVGNQAKSGGTDEARGGAICSSNSQSNMFDSILWGNSVSGSSAIGNEIEHYSSSSYNNIFNLVNCCVKNQTNDIYEVVSGTIVLNNTIHTDPQFTSGLNGNYYLEQIASGGNLDSPCVDKGSDTAVNLDLDRMTTRTDGKADDGTVDMGFHYDS